MMFGGKKATNVAGRYKSDFKSGNTTNGGRYTKQFGITNSGSRWTKTTFYNKRVNKKTGKTFTSKKVVKTSESIVRPKRRFVKRK